MKKIFAIAMLALLLFNLGAYQLLFQYFIYQSDVSINEQINNNQYKSTDLVEIKIPVHLTIENWDGFKPVSGQVKLKNNCYNYAELKLTRDTMYLMCIPNYSRARILTAKIVYAKAVNDMPISKKAHDPVAKKINTLSEYNLLSSRYNCLRYGILLKQTDRLVSSNLDRPFIESPGKPPNFTS